MGKSFKNLFIFAFFRLKARKPNIILNKKHLLRKTHKKHEHMLKKTIFLKNSLKNVPNTKYLKKHK